MKKVMKLFLLVALAALIAMPAVAADKEKKKKKGAGRKVKVASVANLLKKLEKADLSEEQSVAVKKLVAEHTPKIREAQKKVYGMLSAEQRKAAAQARNSAKEAGKKGKELQAAVETALSLSDDEKTARKAAQTDARAAKRALQTAVGA